MVQKTFTSSQFSCQLTCWKQFFGGSKLDKPRARD